jgi:hypothetical protein
MKSTCLLLVLNVFILSSCNQAARPAKDVELLILRIELDSAGEITGAETRAKVMAIGKELHQSGNKMMMHVYTEQLGSTEKNNETGWMMARAVKALMKTQGERVGYNMGVDVRGFENPIDSARPENIINRRIEIVAVK